MCLAYQKSFKTNGIGYKWAVKSDDAYFPPNAYPYSKQYSRTKVNKAENVTPCVRDAEWGFHIFNNLDEAKKSIWGEYYSPMNKRVLLKVKYSKIRFTGIGTGLTKTAYSQGFDEKEPYQIIVAEEMTIIGEVE